MRIPRLLSALTVPVLSIGADRRPVHMLGAGVCSVSLRRMFAAAALSAVLAPSASARAPSAPDVAMLKPIQEWIAAYNSGTAPLPEEIFTQDVVITDEFPPFTWTGISGEHRWAKSIDSFMKPGLQHVSAGAARRFRSTKSGDRVSFVLPATLTFSGKRKYSERALWFYVLVKTASGWKIAADTWTAIGN
jgi:hypothetical protein